MTNLWIGRSLWLKIAILGIGNHHLMGNSDHKLPLTTLCDRPDFGDILLPKHAGDLVDDPTTQHCGSLAGCGHDRADVSRKTIGLLDAHANDVAQ